jgi:hypothetical protein
MGAALGLKAWATSLAIITLTTLGALLAYGVFASRSTRTTRGTLDYYLLIDGDVKELPLYSPALASARFFYAPGDSGPQITGVSYCTHAEFDSAKAFYAAHFTHRAYSVTEESWGVDYSRAADRFTLTLAHDASCRSLITLEHHRY